MPTVFSTITNGQISDASQVNQFAAPIQNLEKAQPYFGGITGGSVNAYVVALNPVLTALASGQLLTFIPHVTNTGAASINVNSLGVRALLVNGSPVQAGQLVAGVAYAAVYDGTSWHVAAGLAPGTLASLSDVSDGATPASGYFVAGDGSAWQGRHLVAGDIYSGQVDLARGGTGVDLSASGGTTKVLAQDASHVITARNLVAADIPSLDASKITTGTIALALLSGITTSQLSATAGIVSGQISDLSVSKLTAGTLGVDLVMGAALINLGSTATFTGVSQQIVGTSSQLIVNASSKINLAIGGSGKVEVTSAGILISGTGEYLNFGTGGVTVPGSSNVISGRATGLEYGSTTGTPHKWFVATTEWMRMTAGFLEVAKLSLGGTIGSSVDPGAGGLSVAGNITSAATGTTNWYQTSLTGLLQIGSGDPAGTGGHIGFFGPSHATSPGVLCIYPGYLGTGSQVRIYDKNWVLASTWNETGQSLVGNLTFTGAGTASAVLTSLWADASAGNLFSNTPTGKYEQRRVAGAGLLSLGRYQTAQGDKYWSIGAWSSNGAAVSSDSGIFSANASIYFNVSTGETYDLYWNGVNKTKFSATMNEMDRLSLGGVLGSSVDGGAGSLAVTSRIQFAGAGSASAAISHIWADASGGNLIYGVPTSKGHYFTINSQTTLAITAGSMILKPNGLTVDAQIVMDSTNAYNFLTFKLASVTQGFFQSGSLSMYYNFDRHYFRSTSGTLRVTIDSAVTFADAVDLIAGTTTGTKIGTSTSQKLGIWNATPIVQPSSTGQTGGFTAGAGTAVDSASTFTGGVGATAYTVGDLIKHLKNFGLLAA